MLRQHLPVEQQAYKGCSACADVHEFPEPAEDDQAGAAAPPPAPPAEALPRLAALTPRAPSPLLRWQLPQLLFAYCAVMRLYNGDYHADAAVCPELPNPHYV